MQCCVLRQTFALFSASLKRLKPSRIGQGFKLLHQNTKKRFAVSRDGIPRDERARINDWPEWREDEFRRRLSPLQVQVSASDVQDPVQCAGDGSSRDHRCR